MAWYDDKNRTTYVAEYKDAKAIDDDAKRAGPKGWMITSTTGHDGKTRVMGTLGKGVLTGGVGLLVFGRSKTKGKTTVSWQRVPQQAPVVVPAAPLAPVALAMPASVAAAAPAGFVAIDVVLQNISAAQLGLRSSNQSTPKKATVQLDPKRRMDADAVQVLVESRLVGVLPVETGMSWCPALQKFGKPLNIEARVSTNAAGELAVVAFLPELV